MTSKSPIFSQIVQNSRVGRGPVIGLNGVPAAGSHRGVDLAVAEGTPVHPVTTGTVVFSDYRPDYGNVVVIKSTSPDGAVVYSLYGHLKEVPSLKIGSTVTTDTALGLSGHTGRVSGVTGDHVHFEMVQPIPGQPIDQPGTLSNYFSYKLLDPKANPYGLLDWNPSRVARSELTSTERVALIKLSDAEFENYKTQLASIETKGKPFDDSYQSANGGYLGRYQMGKDALVDAGYMDKAGSWTTYAQAHGVSSQQDFLKAPAAQDDALRRFTDKNATYIVRNDLDLHIGEQYDGQALSGAGLMFGAHNSLQNLKTYVTSNGSVDPGDGNNFAVSNFVKLGPKVQTYSTSSQASASIGDSAPTDPLSAISDELQAMGWPREDTSVKPVSTPTTTSSSTAPTPPPAAIPPTQATARSGYAANPDGSFSLSSAADKRSPDGRFDKGDWVSTQFDKNGKPTSQVILHKSSGQVDYTEYPGENQTVQRTWAKSGALLAETHIDNDTITAREWSASGTLKTDITTDIRTGDPVGAFTLNGTTYGSNGVRLPTPADLAAEDARAGLVPGTSLPAPPAQINEPRLEPVSLNYLTIGDTTYEYDPAIRSFQSPVGGHQADIFDPATGQRYLLDRFDQTLTPIQPGQTLKYPTYDGDAARIIDAPGNSSDGDTVAALPPDQITPLNAASTDDQALLTTSSALNAALSLIQAIEAGNPLSAAIAGLGLANQLNTLAGNTGTLIPGELSTGLGAVSSGLNLLNALDRGDTLAALGSAANLGSQAANLFSEYSTTIAVDALQDGAMNIAAESAALESAALSSSLGQIAGVIGIVSSLERGDPIGAISAALMMTPATAPIGIALAVANAVFGGLFNDAPDTPTAVGEAYATWDASGHLAVTTTYDEAGGGRSANAWLGNLISGLEQELAAHTDGSGTPLYALIPQRLPGVGYAHDPDSGQGYLRLTWTGADGQPQWRQYDTAGNRHGPDSLPGVNDLVRDFLARAGDAIVPGWAAATAFAHGGELPPPVATGTVSLDGERITRAVLVLGEASVATAHVDFDADDYLEASAWTRSPMLAIDLDGDGRIEEGELVDGHAASRAANSLAWFDANGDGTLNAHDPAFAALRLWSDVNGDGLSQAAELTSMADADTAALRFGARDPIAIRTDGSTDALHRLELSGDTHGAAYATTVGGVLESHEGGETVLHAVNTHAFDGQAAHIHQTADTWNATFDAGDTRIRSTGTATVANTTLQTGVQGDGALRDAGVLSGQAVGERVGDEAELTVVSDAVATPADAAQKPALRIGAGDARVTSDPARAPTAVRPTNPPAPITPIAPFAFVPLAGGSSGSVLRQITQEMIQSADAGLFGAGALPLSALAVAGLPVELPELRVVRVAAEAAATEALKVGDGGTAAGLSEADLARVMSHMEVGAGATPTPPAAPLFVAALPLSQVAAVTVASPASASISTLNSTSASDGVPTPVSAAAAPPPLVLRREPLLAPPVAAATPTVSTVSSAVVTGATEDEASPTPSPVLPALLTVNHAPVASGEAAVIDEDRAVLIDPADLLANEMDEDRLPLGQSLTLVEVSNARHGVVTMTAEGRIRFVPEADYFGSAGFEYRVDDGAGGSATAAVSFEVRPVNDAPLATGEALTLLEDTRLQIDAARLLANDTDIETAALGQVLAVIDVFNARHGMVALGLDGRIEFLPDPDYYGLAGFEYRIADGAGGTATAAVSIEVQPVNDLPVATGEALATLEDTRLLIDAASLLANDEDREAGTLNATSGQTLTVNAVFNASHGSVSLLADGRIAFLPDADYFGVGGFEYRIADGAGGSATAAVRVEIQPVNDAPLATGEALAAVEDERLLIDPASLLVNESDIDDAHGTLSVVALGAAEHGTVAWATAPNVESWIAFTPDANFHGMARFAYTVADAAGATATAMASVQVAAVNDAPLATGEWAAATEDVGLVFTTAQLLANDVDVDVDVASGEDALSIVRTGNALHGAVSLDDNGAVRFLAEADYHGTAGFDYWVADSAGVEAQASVVIEVAAVNDLPVAADDLAGALNEDGAILIDPATLLANDADVDAATDGQVLTLTAVSAALHGDVELLPAGMIRFIPDANYHGAAGFRYSVADGAGGMASAIAVLQVAAVNDAPVATGEAADGDEDHELVFVAADLLANEFDVDVATNGDVLSIVRVATADPATGSARLDADGNVHFVPARDYAGPASFSYGVADRAGVEAEATVRLSILPVNDLPVATGEIVAGSEDIVLSFAPADLLANDSDVDNAPAELSIGTLGNASHGTVEWVTQGDGNRRIVFTPEANFFGATGFDYTVVDGVGGVGEAASARVSINVAGVNDAPVAHGDAFSGIEDQPMSFDVAQLTGNDTDIDGDTLAITAAGNATGGSVAIIGGRVVFTPQADYAGAAGFAYTASDGRGGLSSTTVTLDLAAVNDAPVVSGETIAGIEDTPLLIAPAALLANDTDVDSMATDLHIVAIGAAAHGTTARLGDGTIRFTPDANFSGTTSFTYTVADSAGGETTGTATLQVAGVNDAPVVTGETIATSEDTILTLKSALLANDTDVDNPNSALRVAAVANASHCTVTVNGDGSVYFVPEANYSGNAAFNYTVSDGAGGTASATATLTLAAVNDAPIVGNETAYFNEDQVVRFAFGALLANDTDVETPGSLYLYNVGSSSNGAVTTVGNEVVFTPTSNFSGWGYFNYTVADGYGGYSPGRVDMNFAAVNDAPVTNGELIASRKNVPITLTAAALLANDTDVESPGALSIAGVYGAQHGSASLNGNGDVSFVPEANFTGRASFQYLVRDPGGATTAATAELDLVLLNRNPVAVDDSFIGFEDIAFLIPSAQLLSNDSDADDPGRITVTAVSNASHGTVTLVGSDVRFTPDTNFNGPASFNYTVSDPYGGATQATAYLTVQAVNDAPVIQSITYDGLDATRRYDDGWGTVYDALVDDPFRFNGTVTASDPDGDALEYYVGVAPTHGYAWANTYVPDSVSDGFTHEGGYNYRGRAPDGVLTWTPLTGAWQYFSHRNDAYSGADPFIIRVRDNQGGTADAVIDQVSHYGTTINGGSGGGCPIVLDLNGNGIELLRPEDSDMFADINADGWKDRIGWAAANDGVLCYDANGDGAIDILDEVSFVKYKSGARTDLEGLAGLDSNGDGVISAADAAWSHLGVVAGGTGNGAQAPRWMSLDQAGIVAIGLDRQGVPHLDQGNVVFGTSRLSFADGRVSQVGDVMFAGVGVPLPNEIVTLLDRQATLDLADAELARIRQQALLFNQASATAAANDAPPLAYVPPDAAQLPADLILTVDETLAVHG